MVMNKILTDLILLIIMCRMASKSLLLGHENTLKSIFEHSNLQFSGYFLIFSYYFLQNENHVYTKTKGVQKLFL